MSTKRSEGRRRFILAIVAQALAVQAGAAVLFDSGTPNGFGYYSDPGASQIIGVAFTLAAPATVRKVTWWGGLYSAGTLNGIDNFTIAFYGFAGATPDTTPSSSHTVLPSRTTDGTIFGSLPQYRYTAIIPDTVLATGTFFVSIVNDLDDPDDDWVWSRTSAQFPFFEKNAMGDPWVQLTSPDDRLAVILSDDGLGSGGGSGAEVPEPATLAISGLALAGLLAGRNSRGGFSTGSVDKRGRG